MAKAKTKVTIGQTLRCLICTFFAKTGEAYKNHVLKCTVGNLQLLKQ